MEPQPPNSSPGQSDQVIRQSLRCFVYSLLGLVPILGIPYALAAMIRSRKVRNLAGSAWNPAAGYLTAARRIAPLGFLTSTAFLLLACVLLPAVLRDLNSGHTGST